MTLTGLVKRYGPFNVVDNVDLAIAPGEFMTFLGPSGSGKTTTLNLIAGFAQPDEGQIQLGGRTLAGIPPHKRDIGVVFQNYALFPHMKVDANIAFPLKQRQVRRAEIVKKVGTIIDAVGLTGMANRYPRELSGGQQQRVALARALVFEPQLLLLDEPLGALDKRLRADLQLEIKRIHRELGITFVFVTHDQEEALAMSDRIAVFNRGRIEQVGSGSELYECPQSLFVAEFLGDSNVFHGDIVRSGPSLRLRGDGYELAAPDGTGSDGCRSALVVRPERIRITAGLQRLSADRVNRLSGTVTEVVYFGGRRRLLVDVDGRSVMVDEMAPQGTVSLGTRLDLEWDRNDAVAVRLNSDEQAEAS
ncbi:ABC transporter ATP-binding protein [Mycolicibacterium sp.]|uniref:ABC transporter ATP-binding protein n=1 Tax=Mycolicibacterium sp. TaxID=2320850 RepID=UPI003D11F0AF